jgi:hypothetical protein
MPEEPLNQVNPMSITSELLDMGDIYDSEDRVGKAP